VLDRRTGVRFLEMWGMFENGNFFMLRSSVESIKESVAIANRFLAYVGIIAAFASGLIIWYVSGKVTEPILQLTDISKRMIHLDFEAKYTGRSRTEVALLGENINKLSGALEKTISELKTANNELEKDIEQKTKIDLMRKELLSNISHELKTPIALIQGYAEGLKEQINEDAESREFYCDVIMDEASKMNNLVKKIMTLNELEFGNDNVTMERFDIVALICNYIQSAQILTEQKGVTVRVQDSSSIYVWADEFKTEEVFANYFTNAVNHATGEKLVEVKFSRCGDSVRVSVVNTGMPIPEESLDKIWDKFYKVDKARTREYGGSGVGLSIVKAIMNSMNQEFGVINYENGVEFWFELDFAGAGKVIDADAGI
ncbi:MAG: HAMP domain-containing protein, partial [Ruminococcaceae bacterium]|nr:HAMP domain-containing protein [Oscillospiraceae bacterium]